MRFKTSAPVLWVLLFFFSLVMGIWAGVNRSWMALRFRQKKETTNIGTFTKEDLEICLKMNLCWIFPEGPLALIMNQ